MIWGFLLGGFYHWFGDSISDRFYNRKPCYQKIIKITPYVCKKYQCMEMTVIFNCVSLLILSNN